jgi:isopenicillin N synthase-like dioxygenase
MGKGGRTGEKSLSGNPHDRPPGANSHTYSIQMLRTRWLWRQYGQIRGPRLTLQSGCRLPVRLWPPRFARERRSAHLAVRGFYAGPMVEVPEIDIGPLRAGGRGQTATAAAIDAACRQVGFFSVVGHDVDPDLQDRLDSLARQFFDRPRAEKNEIAMAGGGRAWRGWFPVGGELTDGVPDDKEGLYFGAELGPAHPRFRARTPMHGPNLFPRHPKELQEVVLSYMGEMTGLGQTILSGIGLGLGLGRSWFSDHLTADPLTLFRIFRYPASTEPIPGGWGVAEHTDYGLLTILGQDANGGLQVRTPEGWIDVSPRPGRIVCNLGDMLERLTGGRYRSTPHRVRNTGPADRLSFPFFLDPSWDATVDRLPIIERPVDDDAGHRWDHMSVHGFEGTYGDYILSKVGKVFPDLAAGTIAKDAPIRAGNR